jgi:hypothetical protein
VRIGTNGADVSVLVGSIGVFWAVTVSAQGLDGKGELVTLAFKFAGIDDRCVG